MNLKFAQISIQKSENSATWWRRWINLCTVVQFFTPTFFHTQSYGNDVNAFGCQHTYQDTHLITVYAWPLHPQPFRHILFPVLSPAHTFSSVIYLLWQHLQTQATLAWKSIALNVSCATLNCLKCSCSRGTSFCVLFLIAPLTQLAIFQFNFFFCSRKLHFETLRINGITFASVSY